MNPGAAPPSLFARLLERIFPKMPDFFAMLTLQCQQVAQTAGLEFEGSFAEHFGFETGDHGDIQLNGSLNATGDIVAAGISLDQHKHGGVRVGTDESGEPL